MASHAKISLIFTLVFLISCANQLPPSGGEIDRIPPMVTETFPADGTTNFKENYIELTFSEYVDKRSANDAVFISPLLEYPLEFDWSGKSLTIYFEDTLKSNTTYTVTVGTTVKDINAGNRMASAEIFSFSTGPTIDKARIEGKVYDDEPNGVFIYAYKNFPELNILKQKPDYVSQAGEDGRFILSGLAPGDYNILAVRDEFGDLIYSVGQDEYAVTQFPVKIEEDDTLFNGLKFRLTTEDTLPPAVAEITMINANTLIVEFTEKISNAGLSADNFGIVDSASGKKINNFLLQKEGTKEKQIVLSFSDSLSSESNAFLLSRSIADAAGNILEHSADGFTVSNRADTTDPAVKQVETGMKSKLILFDYPTFVLRLSEGIHTEKFLTGISFSDKNNTLVKIETQLLDDANILINVTEKLKPKSKYVLKYNSALAVDAAGNRGDSVHSVIFTTFSKLDFSGVSGVVKGVDSKANNVLTLYSSDGQKREYTTNSGADGTYAFESVLPGKYLLWAFVDSDSSGSYSYGKIKPFTFSERFTFYPDTLNLRARWPLVDVFLEY